MNRNAYVVNSDYLNTGNLYLNRQPVLNVGSCGFLLFVVICVITIFRSCCLLLILYVNICCLWFMVYVVILCG